MKFIASAPRCDGVCTLLPWLVPGLCSTEASKQPPWLVPGLCGSVEASKMGPTCNVAGFDRGVATKRGGDVSGRTYSVVSARLKLRCLFWNAPLGVPHTCAMDLAGVEGALPRNVALQKVRLVDRSGLSA